MATFRLWSLNDTQLICLMGLSFGRVNNRGWKPSYHSRGCGIWNRNFHTLIIIIIKWRKTTLWSTISSSGCRSLSPAGTITFFFFFSSDSESGALDPLDSSTLIFSSTLNLFKFFVFLRKKARIYVLRRFRRFNFECLRQKRIFGWVDLHDPALHQKFDWFLRRRGNYGLIHLRFG